MLGRIGFYENKPTGVFAIVLRSTFFNKLNKAKALLLLKNFHLFSGQSSGHIDQTKGTLSGCELAKRRERANILTDGPERAERGLVRNNKGKNQATLCSRQLPPPHSPFFFVLYPLKWEPFHRPKLLSISNGSLFTDPNYFLFLSFAGLTNVACFGLTV